MPRQNLRLALLSPTLMGAVETADARVLPNEKSDAIPAPRVV